MNFGHLLQPVRMGELELRNRIVMPGMVTAFQHTGKHGLDLHKSYYEARARGGAGLVIVESTTIDYRVGRNFDQMLAIDDDKLIAGLSEIAQAIQKHGAKAGIQLMHAGHVAKAKLTGVQPVGPTAVTRPGYDSSRALTVSEIAHIVEEFAEAAERIEKAGFDGIEIHAAHRFLIAQFLSPAWNRRDDEYGGSIENRARLLLEILRAVRERVGARYPVWCRLNGLEYERNLVEDLQRVSAMAEKAGADAISVTGYPGLMPFDPQDVLGRAVPLMTRGAYAGLAASAKKSVAIPVIAVGMIDPQLGERLLQQNQADLIAMGRALIADPELPNKLKSGKPEDIRPCVHCSNCLGAASGDTSGDCSVNAAKGREQAYELTPAEKRKKVVVIGGGPAGMEAASTAAKRGHDVQLYEKERTLGGQLILAGLLREDYAKLRRYLVSQVERSGVRVHLGRQFDSSQLDSIRPDVVIVASGPAPKALAIPGNGNLLAAGASERGAAGAPIGRARWRRFFWYQGLALLKKPILGALIERVANFWMPLGHRVVIIGGDLAGLELADYLVKKNRAVTIVETRASIVGEATPMYFLAHRYFHDLARAGVNMLTGIACKEIVDQGLVIVNGEGKQLLLEADSIVLAGSVKNNSALFDEVKRKVAQAYILGDCLEPSGIPRAIAEAARIGRAI